MSELYPRGVFQLDDIVDCKVLFWKSNRNDVFKLGKHVFQVKKTDGVCFVTDLEGVEFYTPYEAVCKKCLVAGMAERCDYMFMSTFSNQLLASVHYFHGHYVITFNDIDTEEEKKREKFLAELQQRQ